MGGAPQVAMRVASQIWHIVFALQTLQVFRLALRKKAQYVVVIIQRMKYRIIRPCPNSPHMNLIAVFTKNSSTPFEVSNKYTNWFQASSWP
jgi:hypothetical protein